MDMPTRFFEGQAYEDVWVIRKKRMGLMLGIKGNKTMPRGCGIPSKTFTGILIAQVFEGLFKTWHKGKHVSLPHAWALNHVRSQLDLRLAEDIERLKAIYEDTFWIVMKYKGLWSGEAMAMD